MFVNLILFCALAALIELDDTYIGQLGISSPFVTGIIFGAIIGDISTGLQVGVFTTLLLLDYTPVGGVIGPNGTVAVFCTLMLTGFGVSVYAAFFFGIVCGILFKTLERFYRTYMGRTLLKKEAAMQLKPERTILSFMAWGISIQFMLTFTFLLVFVFISRIAVVAAPEIPEKMHLALKLSFFAVPWLGIMLALKKFTFKVR